MQHSKQVCVTFHKCLAYSLTAKKKNWNLHRLITKKKRKTSWIVPVPRPIYWTIARCHHISLVISFNTTWPFQNLSNFYSLSNVKCFHAQKKTFQFNFVILEIKIVIKLFCSSIQTIIAWKTEKVQKRMTSAKLLT